MIVIIFTANPLSSQPADTEIDRRNPHGGLWCYNHNELGSYCKEGFYSARSWRQIDFDEGYTNDLNVYYFTGRAYCAEGQAHLLNGRISTSTDCFTNRADAWRRLLSMRRSYNSRGQRYYRNLQLYYREYQRRPTSEISDDELSEMERRL